MTTLTKEMSMPRFATAFHNNLTLGGSVIDFGELLPILKGPSAGQAFHYLNWQKWLLNRVFEVRPDYHLRYRRGVVGVARQNGKSVLGSRCALHALVRGPFGSEVYSAAGDRQQAKIVFGEARSIVLNNPYLSHLCKVYKDAIEVPERGSVYRALAADAKLQQGLSPFFVVFDELHVQPNEDLYDALTLGMGARHDAMVLAITTAGFDEESLCGRLYQYGMRVANGEVDDDSFGFWWWEPEDPLCDIFDATAWAQANPSFFEGVMLDDDMTSAAKNQREAAFRRFRLNQWVPLGGEQWMDMPAWDRAARPGWLPPLGDPIVLGFDGSVSRDCTALVGLHLPTWTTWVHALWEPTPGDLDWQVPRDEVDGAVEQAFIDYDVKSMGCDPAWWRGEVQGWAERWPDRIYEWPVTNERIAPAVNATFARIVAGNLHHNADPRLRRHVANSIVRDLGPRGEAIRKIKRDSTKWIDAAIALVIAVDVAERQPWPAPEEPGTLLTF